MDMRPIKCEADYDVDHVDRRRGFSLTAVDNPPPFRLGCIRWVTRRDMTLRGSLRQPFFDCLLSRQGRMSPACARWPGAGCVA